VIGSLIAGALVQLALVALLTTSPRWDDHLINATSVLGGALLVSVVLWFATAAFRPRPGAARRATFISIMWIVALVLLIGVVISVAVFINNMSFL
jgi:hypothetical protein